MAANFEIFLILPDFPINFRKSHQISKNYVKSIESYGQKPLEVPEDPPGLNRVKFEFLRLNLLHLRPGCPFTATGHHGMPKGSYGRLVYIESLLRYRATYS